MKATIHLSRFLLLALVLALAGCATISKVERGEQVVRGRLVVQLDGPWNQFDGTLASTWPTWTVEGQTVDRLVFVVGLKDGGELAPPLPGAKDQRPLTFRATMQPHEVVALYQAFLTRDGSTFTLDKLEPVRFLDGNGFRFRFSVVRRFDDVRISGMGYAAVRGGELFAIVYSAPRLGFFPRYEAQVEKMAQSARLRG